MKYYACYEKQNNWQLVVYHGEKPGKPSGGDAPQRTEFYEVPDRMIEMDGSPNLGLIGKEFINPFAPVVPEPKEEEWPLPDWAVGRSQKGFLTLMQQLITKDPEARGNATLADMDPERDHFLVVTDANNWMKLTMNEVDELFKPGPFILKEFPNPKSNDHFNDPRTF